MANRIQVEWRIAKNTRKRRAREGAVGALQISRGYHIHPQVNALTGRVLIASGGHPEDLQRLVHPRESAPVARAPFGPGGVTVFNSIALIHPGCNQVAGGQDGPAGVARLHTAAVRGPPPHGLSSNTMALITSDCDAMRSAPHQMARITSDCAPFRDKLQRNLLEVAVRYLQRCFIRRQVSLTLRLICGYL